MPCRLLYESYGMQISDALGSHLRVGDIGLRTEKPKKPNFLKLGFSSPEYNYGPWQNTYNQSNIVRQETSVDKYRPLYNYQAEISGTGSRSVIT